MYNQVNISSGHSVNCQGASDIVNEVTEAKKVVDRVYEIVNASGKACYKYHDTASGSSQNLANIVNWHNQYKDGVDVSIHFNAYSHVDKAMGVEVCYYNDSTLASQVSSAIANAGGFIDRGAKQRTNLYFLKNTKKPAILIEVCFVDSVKDVELYKANFENICQAIAKSLIGGIEIVDKVETPVINTPVATTPQPTQSQYDKAKEYNKARCLEIQQKLNKIGYSLAEDNIYGSATHSAIGNYQGKNGLTVDYLMGSASFKKLDSIIASKNTATSKGDDWIRRLQDECNKQGFRDKNGNKLSEDGILGEMTISAMPVIKKGTRGNITKLVQELLVSKGYDTGGVDGIAGGKTESAIRNYQRARNISVDGCFGKDSLRVYGK